MLVDIIVPGLTRARTPLNAGWALGVPHSTLEGQSRLCLSLAEGESVDRSPRDPGQYGGTPYSSVGLKQTLPLSGVLSI